MKHTTIKKILAIVLCAAAVITLFAGCSKEKDKKDTQADSENTYSPEWVLEPTISAQAIDPLIQADFNENTNHYDVKFADCFRIMQGGKYGIINFKGEIVVEPEFDDIFAIRGEQDFLGIKQDSEGNRDQTYIHGDTFKTGNAYKTYNSVKYEYYWNTAEKKAVFVKNEGGDAKDDTFSPSLPEVIKGVTFEGNKYVYDGTYGLYFNSVNVTGMIYSGAGCFSDGKAAFKSNGKWGYIDSSGRTVIPFEYDAVWGYSAFGGEDTPFESYDGFITLCKNKKFGVVDEDGKTVVPFIFDGATPVVDGKAFVKTEGKWGIILVDGEAEKITAVSEESSKVTEKKTEEETEETENSSTKTTKEKTTEEEETEEERTIEKTTEKTTTEEAESDYSKGTYRVTETMNLREGAGTDYEVLTTVDSGSVYIDKVSGSWGHTRCGGYDGWISLKYLEKVY